jgi:hypothetical protein
MFSRRIYFKLFDVRDFVPRRSEWQDSPVTKPEIAVKKCTGFDNARVGVVLVWCDSARDANSECAAAGKAQLALYRA